MSNLNFTTETILSVYHWSNTLFSFTCTRNSGLRFINGQFVMMGLIIDDKPLLRAYSIVSANYEEHLEFYSIKVQNGPLTSKLQHLKVGDKVIVSKKPTGTLVQANLLPGKHLYLLSTGTGLAPFMSIIKDPDIYDRYNKVILTHSVRYVNELGYHDYIQHELPNNEYFGDIIQNKLIYYPTVTREPFKNQGRLTELIKNGKLCNDIGLPPFDPAVDRALICGNPNMLNDLTHLLNSMDFQQSPRMGTLGDYAIERAFVEK